MRDIVLTIIVLGTVPFILARPHIGVMVWSWLGYMNPHRLAYGFAFTFPFSAIVGGATLLAAVFARDRKGLPWHAITFFWLALVLWMNLSTLTALVPVDAVREWDRTMKIMLMILITLMFIRSRERIHQLVIVIALSLGFLGVRGGLNWLLSGGSSKVYGPVDTIISDNNSFGLAMVMTVPLLRYLQLQATSKYLRWGYLAAMFFTALAILATFSRGAFLAVAVMSIFLAWNSKYRIRMFAAIIIVTPIVLSFMPGTWWERMGTIDNYEQDESAMGRLNAWAYAFNLALDHPFVGGGFQVFDRQLFYKYAPNPEDFHDAHSIYFEVLAEQGFVGLFFFLGLGITSFFTAGRIVRKTRDHPELAWAGNLASMLQVSLIGYSIGGAFLGMAYFDLFYHLCALVVLTHTVVKEQLNPQPTGAAAMAAHSAGRMT